MHQLGLTNLTAGLSSTPSHYPHQDDTHPSRINTSYRDPTTVLVREATYKDLPPAGMGRRTLYMDLIIPNLPPPAATMPDNTLPPTLRFPAENDHVAWHRYITAYMPSCAALLQQHLPPPCAGQHNHAAWNATPATWEHQRTSHSNRLSMRFGLQKTNSPPCGALAYRGNRSETPTSARSSPPVATSFRNCTRRA